MGQNRSKMSPDTAEENRRDSARLPNPTEPAPSVQSSAATQLAAVCGPIDTEFENNGEFTLIIQMQCSRKKNFTLRVRSSTTVREVKKMIEMRDGIPAHMFRLRFGGFPIEAFRPDDSTIGLWNVRPCDTFTVQAAMPMDRIGPCPGCKQPAEPVRTFDRFGRDRLSYWPGHRANEHIVVTLRDYRGRSVDVRVPRFLPLLKFRHLVLITFGESYLYRCCDLILNGNTLWFGWEEHDSIAKWGIRDGSIVHTRHAMEIPSTWRVDIHPIESKTCAFVEVDTSDDLESQQFFEPELWAIRAGGTAGQPL